VSWVFLLEKPQMFQRAGKKEITPRRPEPTAVWVAKKREKGKNGVVPMGSRGRKIVGQT